MNKFLFTLCICVFSAHLSFAQMSAGFSLGCINYQGDLTKGFIDPREVNISYGLFVTKRYANPKFALKGMIQTGTITGNDVNYPERWSRNLKFTSPITFVGTAFEFTPHAKRLFDSKGIFMPQKNLFVSAGLGLTFFNPKVSGLSEKAPDRTAEISKTTFTLPVSMGMRFDLDPKWSFAVETSCFITFSDYLDGVSAAASPTSNDKYLFVGFSLIKKWGDIKDDKILKNSKKKKTAVKKKAVKKT